MRPFGRHIDISHMFTGNHMGQRIRQVLMKLFFFFNLHFFLFIMINIKIQIVLLYINTTVHHSTTISLL